jgi:hypothetical protein
LFLFCSNLSLPFSQSLPQDKSRSPMRQIIPPSLPACPTGKRLWGSQTHQEPHMNTLKKLLLLIVMMPVAA